MQGFFKKNRIITVKYYFNTEYLKGDEIYKKLNQTLYII